MRLYRYLPIAFFAGIHGFALFAPYLALVLAATHYIRKNQKRRVSELLAIDDVPTENALPDDAPLPVT
jgi:hypothetical protein